MHFSGISLVLIFSYCICGSLAGPNDSVLPGLVISSATRTLIRATATEIICDAAKPSRQCGADCKTLLFCDGSNMLGKMACPSTKPDCDTTLNTCVAKRPAAQCPASLDSSCPGKEGYFPDAKKCNLYNYCENSKIVTSYACPANYVFDIVLEQCKRGAPCGTINCYGKIVALHPIYPYLYAFCANNVMIEGSYAECPQKTQEFDINEFACVAKCKKEGNIPHETLCNVHYRCLATGPWGALEKTEVTCPPGQNFNKKTLVCDKTPCPQP